MALWGRKKRQRKRAPSIPASEAKHLAELFEQHPIPFDADAGLQGGGLIGGYGGGLLNIRDDPSKMQVFDDELSDEHR